MASITLNGREIPLEYTSWEMKTIQEEIAPIGTAISMVLGRNPEDPKDRSKYAGAEHLATLAKFLRILGNAGLEIAGETGNLTEKQIMRALKPTKLVEAVNACMDALNKGMESEIPEKEEDGPVDVGLEEMKKKKEKTD